jgi:hypothetical protein
VAINSSVIDAALPAAVRAGRDTLFEGEIFFAPVRHHSPACSIALKALIMEQKPAVVLIEGPDNFDSLLPLLRDPRTRPPVAILSQAAIKPASGSEADGEDHATPHTRSAFFPFCDYSPEWVALKLAQETGAECAFIDLPWDERTAPDGIDDDAQSLMAERYLAHSTYLQALATASACRNQDELWEHLFELRPATALRDWRRLFSDIFCYCAMARNDYEPSVLENEGSLPRERHMAAHIHQWRKKVNGPIVVVTGGFHTVALRQMLAAPQAPLRRKKAASEAIGNWLIRYSFDRLDALNGYASGMPSPAFYQRVWESACNSPAGPDLHAVAVNCLADLARQSREAGLTEQRSTADLQSAVLQAVRLAALRGHAGPGREDLLDAVRSCFVKGAIDEGTMALGADVRKVLGGSKLGDIPPSAGSPPLLEDARSQAKRMRVRLDDSQRRTVRLDIYRKESHRQRSRFLHLMEYLLTGLTQWQSGPDFMSGSRLELLIEEWLVAWTPLVEARLIELSADGATLAEAAMTHLRREEQALNQQGTARSASAVALLTRACVLGLHERLPALLATLKTHLDEDGNPGSVIQCAHAMLVLWRGREPLGLQDDAQVRILLLLAWNNALYLMPQLAKAKPADEPNAVASLLSLRALHQTLRADPGDFSVEGPSAWHKQLLSMAAPTSSAPGVACAAAALMFLDGHWTEEQLSSELKARFGCGAKAADAVAGLSGLMAAAPELLLTQARLRQDFNDILATWDDETFRQYLPDLRHAFAQMKPQETASLAQSLAVLNSADTEGIEPLATMHYTTSEADMLAGVALHDSLLSCLGTDGLQHWAVGGKP